MVRRFTSGDLVVGRHVVAVYNGAQFRTNIAPPTDAAITVSQTFPNLPASEDHERHRSMRNASPRCLRKPVTTRQPPTRPRCTSSAGYMAFQPRQFA